VSLALIILTSLTPAAHAEPLKVSGAMAWTTRLNGSMSPSASMSLSPFKYGFARMGVSYRVVEAYDWDPAEATSFTWGVGYDDWHPGTWSVQINNWAPNTPESGWAILTGAEMDVTYKIPFPSGIGRYLGMSGTLNMPFSRPPGVGARLSVRPWRHLTGFVGLRYSPYSTEGATFTYGFGWADWHPFSFSLNYYNWGPNYTWEPNATQNGQVTLSFSWGVEPANMLRGEQP